MNRHKLKPFTKEELKNAPKRYGHNSGIKRDMKGLAGEEKRIADNLKRKPRKKPWGDVGRK